MNSTRKSNAQQRGVSLLAFFGIYTLCIQGCDAPTPKQNSAAVEAPSAQIGLEMKAAQEARSDGGFALGQSSAQEPKLEPSPAKRVPIAGSLCFFEGDKTNATSKIEQINGAGELPKYRVRIDFDAFGITLEPLLFQRSCHLQVPLKWTPGYRVALRKVAAIAKSLAIPENEGGSPTLFLQHDFSHVGTHKEHIVIGAEGSAMLRFESLPVLQSSCSGSGAVDSLLQLRFTNPTSPKKLDVKLNQIIFELELVKPPADDKDCEKEKGGL